MPSMILGPVTAILCKHFKRVTVLSLLFMAKNLFGIQSIEI